MSRSYIYMGQYKDVVKRNIVIWCTPEIISINNCTCDLRIILYKKIAYIFSIDLARCDYYNIRHKIWNEICSKSCFLCTMLLYYDTKILISTNRLSPIYSKCHAEKNSNWDVQTENIHICCIYCIHMFMEKYLRIIFFL